MIDAELALPNPFADNGAMISLFAIAFLLNQAAPDFEFPASDSKTFHPKVARNTLLVPNFIHSRLA